MILLEHSTRHFAKACRASLAGAAQFTGSKVTARRELSSYACTVVNPFVGRTVREVVAETAQKGQLEFEPRCVVVAATPEFSEGVIEYVVQGQRQHIALTTDHAGNGSAVGNTISEEGTVQVQQRVGAVVDALPFGSQRSGISLLFLDTPVEVADAELLDNSFGDDSKRVGRSGAALSSRGIVSARRTWHMAQGFLGLSLADGGQDLVVPLANTLFSSCYSSTLVFNQGGPESLANRMLSSARLVVPNGPGLNAVRVAAPLIDLESGPQPITAVKDNLLKTIAGQPAANTLQSSQLLMNPAAHARSSGIEKKVFAVLKTPGTDNVQQRVQVIAGGGESWSPRASMLVLEPEAKPQVGMTVQFHLAKDVLSSTAGEHAAFLESNGLVLHTPQDKPPASHLERIVLECAPVLETELGANELVQYEADERLEGVFGLASEQGFLVGESKHGVPGEVVEFSV